MSGSKGGAWFVEGVGKKAAVLAAAAVVAMLALVAGCSQSGSSASTSAGQASSGPKVYQVGELFAMEPAELADYLESQDMAFLSMDALPDSWKLPGAEITGQTMLSMYANKWVNPSVRDLLIQNANGGSALGQEYQSALQGAADGGYLLTFYAFGEDCLELLYTPDILRERAQDVNLEAAMASCLLDPEQLRAGDAHLGIGVDFYPVQQAGGWPDSGEVNDQLAYLLDCSCLPDPAEMAVYSLKENPDWLVARALGFCTSGDKECFYTIQVDAGGHGTIWIAALEDVYEVTGVSDKDSLIKLRLSSMEKSFDRLD